MNSENSRDITRRTMVYLGVATAGGLIVGCRSLGPGASALRDDTTTSTNLLAGYLEITTEGKMKFITTRSEAGQGVAAGFAVLLAEELDVNPGSIEVLYAGINNRLKTLTQQEKGGTGGSSSMRIFYQPVRKIAASARDMLIAAAAQEWQVSASECSVKDGSVVHPPSERSATFGSLANAAAQQPVPQNPTLKAPADYKYIGKKNRQPDLLAKVTGAAVYGIDVKVEGMLNATIVHCPYVGGTLGTVNDTNALAQPGVKSVIKTPYGVAVVADTFWHAVGGARKLQIQWTQTCTASSESILNEQKQLVESPAMVVRTSGDFASAFAGAAKKVEASYQAQYLPHTTLEPQNCTAWVKDDGSCEIWAPTQSPNAAANLAASILGISASKVKVNVTLLGGGFGRRLRQDYVAEAVYVAKELPGKPVKLLWQRSEEFTHDMFRPSSYIKMQAGLAEDGKLAAWFSRTACSSIYSWLAEKPTNLIKPETQTEVDDSSVEGTDELSYAVDNFGCEWAQHEPGVPVFWWRSVGNSQNAFFVESFVDECAKAAGVDPLKYRLDHLNNGRMKAVLELVRDKSGWDTPAPAGRARGVAICASFGSIVAQVVEVSVETRTIYVHKVTVAVDCGTAVDAGLVHTQMESCVAQALAATTKQEITLTNGRVNENSLNDCQPLVMSEMPVVETHIIESTAAPGGIGEPGVPPLAPAVANAVAALTGTRLRSLPLRMP